MVGQNSIHRYAQFEGWPMGELMVRESDYLRRVLELETELRKEWWVNHGHSLVQLYGDDGEMQCSKCFTEFPGYGDFRRCDFDKLGEHVRFVRLQTATQRVNENAALKAENTRLRAPVSNAEWHPLPEVRASRVEVNALIAARAERSRG